MKDWPLEVYCMGRTLQPPSGLCHLWKTTDQLTYYLAYQVIGARKIAGLVIGKSYLSWLPAFFPLAEPHKGGGVFLGLVPRLLGSQPSVQRTLLLIPGSLSSSWGTGTIRLLTLENTCISRTSKQPALAWLPG